MSETITMPALAAGMEEGLIVKWLKAEGDNVAPADNIAKIETGKATMELSAERGGILHHILASEGITVPVNPPIAILVEVNDPQPMQPTDVQPLDRETGRAVFVPPGTTQDGACGAEIVPLRLRSSPLARRLARKRGIDLGHIRGSGPGGRIVRIDVEQAAPDLAQAASPTRTAGIARTEEAAEPPRHASARARPEQAGFVEQQAARSTPPGFHLSHHVEVDALLDLRDRMNEQSNGHYTLSVDDFVIKAAALALRAVPEFNSVGHGDAMAGGDRAELRVAFSADDGALAVIVPAPDAKSLSAISSAIAQAASPEHSAAPGNDRLPGVSITISNLGLFGVLSYCAVGIPPHRCILAIGAVRRLPVVRGDECVPATLMSCSLTFDGAALDGAAGARYLAAFADLIEHPITLLV